MAKDPDDDTEKQMPTGLHLEPVVAELSKIGIEPIYQVGQAVVRVRPEAEFNLSCSTLFGDGPANLKIKGALNVGEETPLLDIEISATRNHAAGEGDSIIGSGKQVELLNLTTEIVAPLGHSIVLGVTPTPREILAFVIQVEQFDE